MSSSASASNGLDLGSVVAPIARAGGVERSDEGPVDGGDEPVDVVRKRAGARRSQVDLSV